MTALQRNRIIAVVALILIAIVFVLAAQRILDPLLAIVLTLLISFGVRVLRRMLIRA